MEDLKQIAQEIRDVISEYQKVNQLSFIEDTHTYFIKGKGGEITSNMPSVSTVLHSFYTPFNAAGTRAFKNCLGDPIKEKSLLKEWSDTADYATNKGSRVHFILEQELVDQYGSYKEVRKPIFECDKKQLEDGDQMVIAGRNFIDLMHERGAVLLDTEIVLGNVELGYFGQPDKVWLMIDKNNVPGIVITDWKGLPLDTPIFTDSGWKTMDTLVKEDKVYDKEGDLVDIKNISKVKNKKCFKIKFDNNEEIVSDFEHRWLVFTERVGVKKERVMTTQEIKHYNDNLTKRDSYKILKIENSKPLNNPNINLPIDPYVLGVWLGDGHSIDAKITQENIAVWDEIKNRGYEIGDDVSQGGAGKATTRTIFNMQSELRKLNLLKNKHVPSVYLLSSYEQRLDLLRGLMDSDGTYNKSRKRFVMATTREVQAKYYAEVASSLGVKTTIITYNKKFNGKNIPCYNTEFTTTDFNPFLCRNKNVVLNPKKNKRLYRSIVSVTEVDSVPTKCIEVDSPSNTFLCGKNLLVTHNTNKKKNMSNEKMPWTVPMLSPFEYMNDNSLSHYKLQLPLYGKLLLKMLEGSKFENIQLLGYVIVHLTDDGEFKEFRVDKQTSDIIKDMDVKKYLK